MAKPGWPAQKPYYDRLGIKFVPRAKEQQVAHIGRRGALLRDTIHIVTTPCEAEGLSREFKQIRSDRVVCGNAMLSVSGPTPCNALCGRVPHLLLDINVPTDDAMPGTNRRVQLMPEIRVQAMVGRNSASTSETCRGHQNETGLSEI